MKTGKAKPGRQNGASVVLLRRLSQLVFLCAFGFLFLQTDYKGSDTIEYAVNILFRIDPFLAAITLLATQTFIALMLPALFVLLLALVFGRAFCGWLCPMGSVLDGCSKIAKQRVKGLPTCYPRLGRIVLFGSLLLALFGVHFAGYVDPFSILVRGLVQAFYPAFHAATESFFTFTYTSAPASVNNFTEPIYQWLKDTVLPVDRKYYELAWLSLCILVGIFSLEIIQKRFFCRNVCPIGAMLGLVSRYGLLRGKGGNKQCGKCRVCSSICRMGAVDENREIDMSTCNLCFECVQKCPRQIITFNYGFKRLAQTGTGLTRRQFLGIVATGILLPSVKQVQGLELRNEPYRIRPPGAVIEKEFLGKCVRCAECIQVCIGNALQPALLEGGIDAIFTPKLVSRTGYCEFNCTLCGQVCPTGAIKVLSVAEKHTLKIGHAWFDKNSCLPYAKGIPCMVCEEHCPTPVKAIQFKETEYAGADGSVKVIKQPYIVDEYCIGCGICENKCPLPGKAAIIVTSAGEHRDPKNTLPTAGKSVYG